VLPERFALIGVTRSEAAAESWREHLYGILKGFVGNVAAEFDVGRIDEPVWNQLEENMYLARPDETGALRKLRGALAGAEKGARHPTERHFLSRRRLASNDCKCDMRTICAQQW
jgi:glucose-6-phosphate 1-dehydrogenase